MKTYRSIICNGVVVFGLVFLWYMFMYFNSNKEIFLNVGEIIKPNKEVKIFIPHIIHHKWNSNMVPKGFQSMLESWKINHPHWEQWWWNDTNAKQLITKKFPLYLQLYNSYPSNLHRSDALRYFKILEFGGVYTDLDILSLKPLDSLLEGVHCAFGLEHEGHAYFYHKVPFPILNNGFVACRPGHPFFKFLIDNLKKNLEENPRSIHYSTGPLMVTTMLHKYIEKHPNSSAEDSVTIFPQQYIHPLLDECRIKLWKKDCSKTLKSAKRVAKLEQLKYEACTRLMANNFTNEPTNEAYCNHLWNHCYHAERQNKELFRIETLLNITGPKGYF